MTKALSIVERILQSDKSDLKDLAEIAGVDPRSMYLNADLTGVDLRDQDISFLVGLNTKFEKAILTDSQRNMLRREKKDLRKQDTIKSIKDLRIGLISSFVEAYPPEILRLSTKEKIDINRNYLQELLLDPIVQSTSNNPSDHFGSDYMSASLSGLIPWVQEENIGFFEELFELFGYLYCPVDDNVILVLVNGYLKKIGENLGSLISSMRPTRELDTWWVAQMMSSGDKKLNAMQISVRRLIHPYAVEACLHMISDVEEMIDFISSVNVEIDGDMAERIALYIIRLSWPAKDTEYVLNAKLPPRVRNAVFRQLLAQGDRSRIVKVIMWLDDNRGAAGALSLENAFVHIKDFDIAYKLAERLLPHMKANQSSVVYRALSELAFREADYLRVQRFLELSRDLSPPRSK